ncbi:MAG: 16S rRNA (cytosine(967)-C(5))-methyltransferase RsmB [Rhodoferax sp.]|nr:16S rRNA (cytosine(967)-C(5))-methyltransferase RsmB [Rhodoferax sp.]MCF8210891.1 16S rRNA (cytosine(967)-C(5))-methyltransferase RsmB [Rhodoferax sp.]
MQLQATARVIQSVRKGTSGAVALEAVSDALRPGVQALAFDVWRHLGRAEALRHVLVKKLPPPDADALLCVALALVWDADTPRYEPFTLVNQAVEAAKRGRSTRMQANFLNACLRRFLRERTDLLALTEGDLVAVWNYPSWWIKRVQVERPDHWRDILAVGNTHAPMTLRVNSRKLTAAEYLTLLCRQDVPAQLGVHGEIYLDEPMSALSIPGFHEGLCSVQDAAAQLAAPLLLNGWVQGPGVRVLDACAAPGGKTGHLCELGQVAVTALEIDPRRIRRMTQNLHRLGLSAHVLEADAAKPQDWWDGNPFQAILLDAPCTASGIVRRHPDIRWARRESDVEQLAAIQCRLLEALWGLLAPGGRLLYCTCSVFFAEGEGQIQSFLTHHSDACLLDSPGHLMPLTRSKSEDLSDNRMRDHDGFYYALLQKSMA